MYTVVRQSLTWSLKGYPNYIVTATDPAGPWSAPTLINTLGFDPSLFIDNNGKGYILVRVFDHRTGKNSSPGIGIHEIDMNTLKPIGEPVFIYSGWNKRSAEGPKMLRKDGYYYLFTAEGGTGYGHYEAVARSHNITGPYERAPEIFYTAKDNPDNPIQKTGHGTLVQTADGEWYTTHLGSRPLSEKGKCPLGRETFIQKVVWNNDGWPVLANGSKVPSLTTEAPSGISISSIHDSKLRDEFDNPQIGIQYQFPRQPADQSWLRLDKKTNNLSIRGRHALGTYFDHSLVVQRITSLNQEFYTSVEFSPTNFRHSAGITCYYNNKYFYALGLTYDEEQGTALELTGANKTYKEYLDKRIAIPADKEVFMKMKIDREKLTFFYSLDNIRWTQVGDILDFSIISDDHAGGFTGAMVGLYTQDLMYSTNGLISIFLK